MSKIVFGFESKFEEEVENIILPYFEVFTDFQTKINENQRKCIFVKNDESICLFFPNIETPENIKRTIIDYYNRLFPQLKVLHDDDLFNSKYFIETYPSVNIKNTSMEIFLNRELCYYKEMPIEEYTIDMLNALLINNGSQNFIESKLNFSSLTIKTSNIFQRRYMLTNNIANSELEKMTVLFNEKGFTIDDVRIFENSLIKCLIGYMKPYFFITEKKNDRMWCFDEIIGIWKLKPRDIIIREYISEWLPKYFEEFLKEKDLNRYNYFIFLIKKELSKLQIINRLSNELIKCLIDPDLKTKLDQIPHLIGFQDKIYNINTNRFYVGEPQDYISLQTNIMERSLFDTSKKEIIENQIEYLTQFFCKIFPNEDIRDTFYTYIGSLLEGGNAHKILWIWWGPHNNGKSLIQRLLRAALGNYSGVLPSSFITSSWGNSSKASPDISYLIGKLAIFINEPNATEHIQTGTIKLLASGSDPLTTRGLYEKDIITFINKTKITLVVNNPLYISGVDIATIRRTMVIPWTTTFLEENQFKERSKSQKHIYPVDPSLEKTILQYKEAIMYMMIKEYRRIAEKGKIDKHEIIDRATRLFFMKKNLQFRFSEECFEYREGENVETTSIYEQFKEYFGNLFPLRKIPTLDQFVNDVSSFSIYQIDYSYGYNIRLLPNNMRKQIDTDIMNII